MGLVAFQGKWARPDEVSHKAQDDPRRKAVMQEYLQHRAKTSEKAEDQWKLAVWCEQNGLKDQAIAQYHAVLRPGPDPRGRLEATWASRKSAASGSSRNGRPRRKRGGRARPGEQALEADPGAVARRSVQPGQGAASRR